MGRRRGSEADGQPERPRNRLGVLAASPSRDFNNGGAARPHLLTRPSGDKGRGWDTPRLLSGYYGDTS